MALAIGTADGDTITGSPQADFLFGLDGADIIVGDAGADTLFGGLGDDTLTAGEGADVIVIAPGGGMDTLTDFDPATDKLVLSGASAFAVASVTTTVSSGGSSHSESVVAESGTVPATPHFSATADGVIVDFGDGSSVHLLGVHTTDWWPG